jgi:uncharacterized membrane protein
MTFHEWSPPYATAVYVGLALGLLAVLFLARRYAKSPTARRWPLLLLRGLVLGVLLLILLNYVRVTETRLPPRVPEVAYLIDCSRSMALDRPTSRLSTVKHALAHAQPPGDGPRVSLYRFGEQLQAVSGVHDLQPVDDHTRLLEALEQLPARFRDGLPGGVVIFSDGRATDGTELAALAAGYRKLGVPLHVFPVGDARTSGDVAIEDVVAPRDAQPGTRLPVSLVVRCRGYSGYRAELRVRLAAEPNRRPLATLPVTLSEGRQTYELRVENLPGPGQLVAEVLPLPGEAILENNRVAFQVGARRSKTRVIYMEGTVHIPEYKWIRDALHEDPNIECVAMEVDNQYVEKPVLHRVGDPGRGYPTTREELFGYDVVICSDINRTAFTQEQLDWTVELVHRRGGGFAMVGGNTSFSTGFWHQTAWDGLIPVDMSRPVRDQFGQEYHNGQFRTRIAQGAEQHPIWRIVDDPVQNRQILNRMPPFLGANYIERLKPGATLLGTTDGPLPGFGRVMPTFACQSYGKGRTFAMAPDSTYAWGEMFEKYWGEGDNRYFRKFWRNVVNWLAENSAGANRRLRIETDRVIYRPGEPIQLTARAYDDKLEETDRYRLVARLRPAAAPPGETPAPIQEVTLTPRPGDRRYEAGLTTPPLHLVPVSAKNPLAQLRLATLDVTAYDGDRVAAQANLDVQVLDDPPEFQDPRPDAEQLEELAKQSGGKVLHGPEDLTALLATFKSTPGDVVVSRAPAWDHAGWWLVLLGLLTVDWALRRWWGLA